MTVLSATLKEIKNRGQKGLIAYFTAGFPDYESTYEAVLACESAGVDAVEIGIPFSDPMADGPVIQKASDEALKRGATVAKTLELVRAIRQKTGIPLAVMVYMNNVMQYGCGRFIQDFAAAGLNGLIVPDVPYEESEELSSLCRNKLEFIRFIAPTTDQERIAAICRQAQGFVYCISSTGVTGVRQIDYGRIGRVIAEARNHTDVPMAIGFGIGTPAAACQAAQYADAVIVGSALVSALNKGGVSAAKSLAAEIKQALAKGGGQ